jgi:hypothetical protein
MLAPPTGEANMSHLSNGIFGALAVSLTFGAIQFASGSDLGAFRKDLAPTAAQANSYAVNRSAKSDRGMIASASDRVAQTNSQTLSFRLDSLADTSVLMRLPSATPAVQANAATPKTDRASGSLLSQGDRKSTVACEPVVSVLTDVAKRLAPGRCMT